MALGKQAQAKSVLEGMRAAGENTDPEDIITKTIAITSPGADPRLFPSNPRLAYADRSERFSLARKILVNIAYPKVPPPADVQQAKRSVVINLDPTDKKSEKWEEADEKTKIFRENVKRAGFINLDKKDQEYLNNQGLLPEKLQGTEITSALQLYAKGAKASEIEQKAESSQINTGERDYLLRTSYFIACFEEANLKKELPSSELLQTANLSPEVTSIETYNFDVKAEENQFVFASDGQSMTPMIPSGGQPNQVILEIQDKLKDMTFDAIEKGGKKLVKKELKNIEKAGLKTLEKAAGKKIAGIAAKAGVKAATKAAAMAAAEAIGTTIPGLGNIIAWLVVEVGDKLITLAKKSLGKIKKLIEEHKGEIALLGIGAIVGGLIFASVPLILLGAGILLIGGSAAVGTAGAIAASVVAVISVILSSVAAALGRSFLFATILLLTIIVTFYIITVGGYVVPFWSNDAYNNLNVNQENPYIGVGKVANPTESANPTSVTYTITITAKQGNLTNVQISDYTCRVYKKNNQNVNCPSTTPTIPPDVVVEVNNQYQFSYTINYGSAYADALVVDTITITADAPTQSGVSASSTASVCFGDCPSDCVKVVPGGWPANTESNLLSAIATLSSNYAPFMQKVCASSFGDINLCYNAAALPDGGNCNRVTYGRHIHTSTCDINFNRCGIGSVSNATFILTHELTHHIQSINGSWLQAYLDSGAKSEAPYCTYSATTDNYEAHAESTALYVGPPSWNQCISPSYQAQYPQSFQFARDVMFH